MFSLHVAACDRKFGIDFDKPAALSKAPGGACRRMRGCNKSVPPPKVALGRDQALPGLERSRKPAAGVAFDNADLRKPACELRRRLDVARQRLDSVGKGRVAALTRHCGPLHWRRRINWRIEIGAKRCPERLFVALLHGDVVDHRRPKTA